MELEDIIRHIEKRWYILVTLAVVAIAGTWLYHNVTGKARATALVAVKQPVVAAPGEYIPPQITFETMDESNELANRIAARLNDGSTGEDIKAHLDVRIQISSEPSFTPLYEVSYSDANKPRALAVDQVVLEEATKLYNEINVPAEKDVQAAFDGEITRLQGEIDSARADLSAFERDNDAFDLSTQIDRTSNFINDLKSLKLQAGIQSDTSAGLGLTFSQSQTDASIDSIDTALADQQKELLRLKDLEPRWSELSLNVQRLEIQLSSVRQHIVETVSDQALPAEGQVQLLSQPEIQSNLFFIIVTYGLALVISLFIGLTIIYLMAIFDRSASTMSELEARLGLPVLARVPQEAQ